MRFSVDALYFKIHLNTPWLGTKWEWVEGEKTPKIILYTPLHGFSLNIGKSDRTATNRIFIYGFYFTHIGTLADAYRS